MNETNTFTQTWETAESENLKSASSPRLIRFFRADDPFDATDSFKLETAPLWQLGRVDAPPPPGAEGRIWTCDDSLMSSKHAVLAQTGGRWTVSDTGSKNGTFVNGRRLSEPHVLEEGDLIEAGHSFFVFQKSPPAVAFSGDVGLGKQSTETQSPLYHQIGPLLPYVTSDISIHLSGETGTGKEVIARAIHNLSGRQGAFVARNCAAIPEPLFESELFGHSKGAFSGATSRQEGQILAAHKGTLFLDEIAELSLGLQAKLLRVLELKEVQPVGSSTPSRVDFRLVSATLSNLEDRVKEGRFRHDLYGRLGHVFDVPPLRANKHELGNLIQAFLAAHLTSRRGSPGESIQVYFTLAAARAMVAYGWPYNIRELKMCLDTALMAAMANRKQPELCAIDVVHLPKALTGGATVVSRPAAPSQNPVPLVTDQQIREALTATNGNRSEAAKRLGVTERTVFRRLRKMKLDSPDGG